MYSNGFLLILQGLLLLQQLTKSNAAIQKIVAFENAFERLLDIITEEGSSDGGKKKQKKFLKILHHSPGLIFVVGSIYIYHSAVGCFFFVF